MMENLPVVAAVVISFLVTAIMGLWLVPLLHRIKYGQTILDIGPRWHKKKQGTPTMGGLMFVAGILLATLAGLSILLGGYGGVGYNMQSRDILAVVLGLAVAVGFGFVGFVDDFIKVIRKRNLGLSERQKLIMQFVIAGIYLIGMYLIGDSSTIVFVPFFGQVNLGLAYYPLAILGIVFMINVVNFTDGIDGLCASVTFVVSLGFLAVAGLLHNEGMSMFAGALAGGTLGFLIWNLHPARIFMGDTGSMFLGGIVVVLAFGLKIPIILIFMGIIYIIEGVSVMIQTTYFKYTRRKYGEGRRIFRMTPIHHHYEMGGWSEGKIVVVFSLVQLVFSAVAVMAVMRI